MAGPWTPTRGCRTDQRGQEGTCQVLTGDYRSTAAFSRLASHHRPGLAAGLAHSPEQVGAGQHLIRPCGPLALAIPRAAVARDRISRNIDPISSVEGRAIFLVNSRLSVSAQSRG